MNDFTKEELEQLQFIIQEYTNCTSEPIYKKIQTMIDNYHEPKTIWDGSLICADEGSKYAIMQLISSELDFSSNKEDEHKVYKVEWKISPGKRFKNGLICNG